MPRADARDLSTRRWETGILQRAAKPVRKSFPEVHYTFFADERIEAGLGPSPGENTAPNKEYLAKNLFCLDVKAVLTVLELGPHPNASTEAFRMHIEPVAMNRNQRHRCRRTTRCRSELYLQPRTALVRGI